MLQAACSECSGVNLAPRKAGSVAKSSLSFVSFVLARDQWHIVYIYLVWLWLSHRGLVSTQTMVSLGLLSTVSTQLAAR